MTMEERKRFIKIAQDFFNKHQLTMECNIEAKEFQAFYHILLDYKKLQKENEKERNKNKQLSNSIITIYKEQDNLQARLDRKRDEIREKNKQIDLMAVYISNLDIDEDICKEQSDNNCDDINREADCKDCIKQYFEKLTKENKNET